MTNAPYPYNLIEKLFEERCTEPYDADRLKALDFVIGNLSEREQAILHDRYVLDMSLEETGKKHGVTRERIRQVEAKALRKLRHPSKMKYIKTGYAAASGELRRQVEERHKATLDALEAEYLAKINELREKISLIDDKAKKLTCESEAAKIIGDIHTPINELNLSVRSYNCLTRHGIKTLYDICCLTYDELCAVRHMGKKSVEEVVGCVHRHMYRLKGEPR